MKTYHEDERFRLVRTESGGIVLKSKEVCGGWHFCLAVDGRRTDETIMLAATLRRLAEAVEEAANDIQTAAESAEASERWCDGIYPPRRSRPVRC